MGAMRPSEGSRPQPDMPGGSENKADPKGERSSTWNRRQFLETTLAAGGITAVGTGIGELIEYFEDKEDVPLKRKERITKEPRRLQTGDLAGDDFQDLYAQYTGIKGKAPKEVEINFQQQLRDLWTRKYKRASDGKVVKETGETLTNEYERYEPTFSTLKQYSQKIADTIRAVKRDIDWDKLAKMRGLDDDQRDLVKKVASRIDENDLLSYSLTELMPSPAGKFNKQVLEFLLQNAGEEYVESIPAVYDEKTSFGPYQFTDNALFDAEGKKQGASIVNQALRKGRIPGSVAKLRGQQHHKAAFLFMIENYCKLVKRVNEQQMKVLQEVAATKNDDLLVFAAMAHHGPGIALDIAQRWLDNKAAKAIKVSAGEVYLRYAHMTEVNLEALR